MSERIDRQALDQLFFDARTHNEWQDRPVPDALLQELYDTFRWAPTSANCSPARIVFVKSPEAKEKLLPALIEGNVEKTRAAPVTAIIAYDLDFPEYLPRLFPHTDARSWFEGNEPLIESTAFRNGSLQGAYLILAARALGLDCGPMSGFDPEKVNEAFFAGTRIRANFLCNLGYGRPEALFPRGPRFDFDDVCRIE
ncbi:putative reductase RutE [Thioalkalivibrio nitratireducens DSM 14787]|uniref:Putative NADH dehydrogenase/NAD(P)H nitroreductase TVNIR_1296 n=1 Tax=Thioalkalivibrio nitratireducens (strain DSM 14787 / UNIQEM 213 / ALEN2) TaxID=1255043 RepID=L0DTP1_THIND|nr:malonic semialdehyde reductase [Thioalkalivibrio nitratireducens]AGA32969.1 putative reductase RutE [Thioalkalivibrio nitratireducens DSM 14787]